MYKMPLPQFPKDCSPTGTSISPLTESAHVQFGLYLYIKRLRWLKQTHNLGNHDHIYTKFGAYIFPPVHTYIVVQSIPLHFPIIV